MPDRTTTNPEVVVIGAGPAGLAAALYAGRARLATVVLERGAAGGQASTTHLIENYPGFPEGITGPDLMQRMEQQARRFGAEFRYAEVRALATGEDGRGFLISTSDGDLRAPAVIVATGTEPVRLGVPGEDRLRGAGVSYCATCDGAFFRDKHVLVVGGGDSALVEALFLTRFASRVTVVHRRDELRATKVVQEDAFKNPKIGFAWNSVVDEILGADRVEGVILKDTRTGEKRRLDADGVFVAIGSRPDTGFVAGLADLDPQGYILTDDRMRTRTRGLFAAGDVRAKTVRQVVTAVADGAVAAVEAERHISGH
ncbi:MAG: thioredoxin reductase [Bacillota bacterium]|nr:thioredoxin-disulfide reductase [Bacillota bacterium]MDK2930248.1 thioredoxin reductase [Bacillota bacterium]